ncbi:MAG TPA: glycosyltransferase family 9 protein [Acidobacteriaceae bacterium]|jgi:ADP-heptose:LPS heptosyltransferase|nr:glycosyltransferase family 9 protein [Acidobacteriaceae bacterium]
MQRGRRKNRLLDLWVGTPLLNLLASFHRRRQPPAGPLRRLGVMSSPALGDALLFSAALQDLRAAFPAAEITHLCMRENLAAAEIIPGSDRRVLVNLTRPVETIRRIRAQHFDVLLDFTGWQRLTAFYTLLSGAAYTVGFETPGQRRSRGFDRTVPHRNRHEVENFRALLQGCGLTPAIKTGHAPAIRVRPPETVPFAGETDLVTLHLWASGQRSWLREWPEERWIELAKRLAGVDTLFVITGSSAEVERTEPFVERMRAAGLRSEPFVSPDGFRTLTEVLRRSRLVVSVNTGVMHLAAIAGARLVAINGPNRNGRWGPVGPRAVGVEAPGEGCGYLHLGFDFDGRPTDCMERTSVDQVLAAAQRLLTEDKTEDKEPERCSA